MANDDFNQRDDSDRKPSDRQDVQTDYGSPQDMVRDDLPGEGLFISNNGILFKHWKAVPCVLGKTDYDSLRQSHDHAYENQGSPVVCENGFTYFCAGEVYGIFVNNSKDISRWHGGWVDYGQAYITLNRHYKGTKEAAYFGKYDKLVPINCPSDFFAEHNEEIPTNPTGNDRLQFPATKVVYMSDSDGKRYQPGVDFEVKGCQIHWLRNRPGNGPTGNPKILSVRYQYQPYWYVRHVIHEQRLRAQIDEFQDVKIVGGPSQVLVEQDFVFLANMFKDNAVNSQVQSGQGSNTGPR
jgi:hypothetical protein